MFRNILVPVDLADASYAKPAIANAAALANTSDGKVRILNVLPMTPVMLAEYVPADFDTQQRQSAEEALAIVASESGIPAGVSARRSARAASTTRSSRRRRRSRPT